MAGGEGDVAGGEGATDEGEGGTGGPGYTGGDGEVAPSEGGCLTAGGLLCWGGERRGGGFFLFPFPGVSSGLARSSLLLNLANVSNESAASHSAWMPCTAIRRVATKVKVAICIRADMSPIQEFEDFVLWILRCKTAAKRAVMQRCRHGNGVTVQQLDQRM